MSDRKLECRGLEHHEKAAYLKLAEKAWGRNSPQSEASFLEWLYDANPNTLGMNRDLLVLAEGGDRIVGAFHRMRVPWHVCGQDIVVPSAHDLFVLPSHRTDAGHSLVPPGMKI